MRKRWLGLLLGLLVLATAPGCRVLAGAAIIAGEVALDAALDNDDDDCDCHSSNHHSKRGHHDRSSVDQCR